MVNSYSKVIAVGGQICWVVQRLCVTTHHSLRSCLFMADDMLVCKPLLCSGWLQKLGLLADGERLQDQTQFDSLFKNSKWQLSSLVHRVSALNVSNINVVPCSVCRCYYVLQTLSMMFITCFNNMFIKDIWYQESLKLKEWTCRREDSYSKLILRFCQQT